VFFMDDPEEVWMVDHPHQQNYAYGPIMSALTGSGLAVPMPWSVSNTSWTVATIFQKWDEQTNVNRLYFSSLLW